jgi:hypothetical protein
MMAERIDEALGLGDIGRVYDRSPMRRPFVKASVKGFIGSLCYHELFFFNFHFTLVP